MKLKGRKIEGPNVEIVVIPRKDEDLIFKCAAVLDYSEFDKLCPEPKPPIKLMRGGKKVPNFEDPGFKKEQELYGKKKTYWMFMKSISATEELEFELVDPADSNTWTKFEEEFRTAGFTDIEVQRILRGILDANCLNEQKLEEARERFLASQGVQPEKSSFPVDALRNLQSGAPAKDSA